MNACPSGYETITSKAECKVASRNLNAKYDKKQEKKHNNKGKAVTSICIQCGGCKPKGATFMSQKHGDKAKFVCKASAVPAALLQSPTPQPASECRDPAYLERKWEGGQSCASFSNQNTQAVCFAELSCEDKLDMCNRCESWWSMGKHFETYSTARQQCVNAGLANTCSKPAYYKQCTQMPAAEKPKCPEALLAEAMEVSAAVDVAKACTQGTYKKVDDFEFCYRPRGLTYDAAVDFCQSQGLQLVEPTTPAKAEAVDAVCPGLQRPAKKDCTWLGLKCPQADDACTSDFAAWRWVHDGRALNATQNGMSHDGGRITGAGAGEFCGHWFYKKAASGGMWSAERCESTFFGALCEAPPPAPKLLSASVGVENTGAWAPILEDLRCGGPESLAPSQEACERRAAEAGHPFYSYNPAAHACETSEKCTTPTTSEQWRTYQKPDAECTFKVVVMDPFRPYVDGRRFSCGGSASASSAVKEPFGVCGGTDVVVHFHDGYESTGGYDVLGTEAVSAGCCSDEHGTQYTCGGAYSAFKYCAPATAPPAPPSLMAQASVMFSAKDLDEAADAWVLDGHRLCVPEESQKVLRTAAAQGLGGCKAAALADPDCRGVMVYSPRGGCFCARTACEKMVGNADVDMYRLEGAHRSARRSALLAQAWSFVGNRHCAPVLGKQLGMPMAGGLAGCQQAALADPACKGVIAYSASNMQQCFCSTDDCAEPKAHPDYEMYRKNPVASDVV